jgi:hypothetical protein
MNERAMSAAGKSVLVHFRYINAKVDGKFSIQVLADTAMAGARRIKPPQLKLDYLG